MPSSIKHRKRMLQHLEEQQRHRARVSAAAVQREVARSINATQQKLTKPVGHPWVKGTSGVQRPTTELEGK